MITTNKNQYNLVDLETQLTDNNTPELMVTSPASPEQVRVRPHYLLYTCCTTSALTEIDSVVIEFKLH